MISLIQRKVKQILQSKLIKIIIKLKRGMIFIRNLYSVMQVERWAAYIILSLIIAVATFNILGSLSMSVIEKKRDIGILRSMGATEKSVLKNIYVRRITNRIDWDITWRDNWIWHLLYTNSL